MANFSGAVRIADLNDFIAPSQQCVVSLSGSKLDGPKDEGSVGPAARHRLAPPAPLQLVAPVPGAPLSSVRTPVPGPTQPACPPLQAPGEVQLQGRPTRAPRAARTPAAARSVADQPAPFSAAPAPAAPAAGGFRQAAPAANGALQVTLHDCLACSGCITSAETVLLQHQSTGELLQKLADPATTVVVSLSPQSRASLAALHGLGQAQAQRKLTAFLTGLGAAATGAATGVGRAAPAPPGGQRRAEGMVRAGGPATPAACSLPDCSAPAARAA
jgi:hypothetical protein